MIMKSLLFLSLLCTISTLNLNSYASGNHIAPFQTDYCTGAPEGTLHRPNLWRDCCIKHDMAYYVAGTKKQQDLADKRLYQCVADAAGKFYGTIIYRGVRFGHISPIKSKTRWGWAWKDRPYFQTLTQEQVDMALSELEKSDTDPKLIEEFIQNSGLSRN